MKRKIVALSLFFAVCIAIAVAIIVVNANTEPSLSAKDARIKYEAIMNDIETVDSNVKLYYPKLASFFSEVANGNRWEKAEYAALIREFTQGTIVFSDDEVFSVAKEIADVYSSVANGTKTFGLQDITVSRMDGGMRIAIDHMAIRYYNTCTVENPNEEKLPYGDGYKMYDGSLGKNLIKITLWDCNLSDELAQKHPCYTAFTPVDADGNANTDVKVMFVRLDHSIDVYIGSDKPISVSEQTKVTINRPTESIIVNTAV